MLIITKANKETQRVATMDCAHTIPPGNYNKTKNQGIGSK